jgi:hypothetical protein
VPFHSHTADADSSMRASNADSWRVAMPRARIIELWIAPKM